MNYSDIDGHYQQWQRHRFNLWFTKWAVAWLLIVALGVGSLVLA